MSVFAGHFGQEMEPLQERAAALVRFAQISAVSMFMPSLDRFPILKNSNVKHWDFILTVAGVFMAATRLDNLKIGEDRENRLMEMVRTDLEAWDLNGLPGFDDCKSLFEREYDRLAALGHEPRFLASDAIGKWIVWNVLDRRPETEEECALVCTIGLAVTERFFHWWNLDAINPFELTG